MICGIGCDIVEVQRFKKWVNNKAFLERFFNAAEFSESLHHEELLCEHYAVRFAAKEAFSKALGTGIKGFELTDIFIMKDNGGQPYLSITGKAAALMERRFGAGCHVHVTLSHEKQYAISFVVIERG